MAEKRISVRLAAVGGRQVRAELEGIGEAGSKGFGRLSSEMERANTRLAGFATKAGIALAAMTAAAAAAGVAMIRSGLDTIGAQADMAASLKTSVESLQVLTLAGELAGVSLGEIEQATKKLTTRLSEAASGSGSAVGALERLRLSARDLQALPLDERIATIQDALARLVPEAERAAVASDLFGDKAALAFLRIDPATLREAAKDVRDFGVAVSATDAVQIERTGDAIAKLSLIWLGLTNRLTAAVAPALETIANAFGDAARGTGVLGQAVTAIFDNLGRLTTYAATFATLMAGRWVMGLAAAALSVKGLATSLVILRGALIRTGIGALIVGAGELVYQFTQLVGKVGGLGAAFGLLRDVAAEAWDRLALAATAAWARVEAGWANAQAGIYDGLQSALNAVVGWGNSAVGTFQGAFDGVKAIWGALPQAIGDFAYQAANGLIGGVESMLNAVVTRINGFIEGLNAALALLPDWATGEGGIRIGALENVDLGGIANPFEGAASAAGTAAADAFRAAMGTTYIDTPELFGGMAEATRGRAAGYGEAAGVLSEAVSRPMTAWEALKAAITGAGTEGEDALSGATEAAGALSDGFDTAGQAAGGAGGAAKRAAEEAATGWAQVTKSLADYAKGAMDWGKGLGETLTSAFSSAESAFRQFVTTGKFDFKSLVSSILADLATLAFKNAVLGPLASALSGVFGGGIFGGGAVAATNPMVNASIWHAGGMVAAGASMRAVQVTAFADAPRLHAGGWAGLKPDEVPAILQRGERVLNRREAAGYGRGARAGTGVTVNIDARGAQMGVAEQIDARLRAAIPEIARIAKESVADGRRRGQVI
jgi:lambda family phage tail tape measure protein